MSDSVRSLARRVVALTSLIALGTFASLAGPGCSDAPSEAECRKLLNHYIEIEANSAGVGGLKGELAGEADKVKKRVVDGISEDFMQSCLKNLSKSQLTCGLKAKNADQLASCDDG